MAINKTITAKTSGFNTGTSQVFVTNTVVKHNDTVTSPFNFEVPVYTLNGATYQYYTQNTDGISASLNNVKSLIFGFSANTNSLTGTTKMKHYIYKIDYGVYTAFTNNNITLTDAITTTTSGVSSTILVPSTGASSAIITATQNILSAITQPFYTIFEDVSGTTFLALTSHTLSLPQKVKPEGQYTQELFLDKSQYFINSTFLFESSVNQTLGDVRTYSGGEIVQLYDMPFSSTTFTETEGHIELITGGTFSGITVSGASFTYFVPPKKADINVVSDAPAVQGTLRTFAPIFSFKNVEDGDYYTVQVNYNTGDTAFTGDTTFFNAQKQPGNAEQIRTFAVALTPNSEFLYRIGNVKELINMFQVKQNVTTYSEFVYAVTANDGTFVLSGHTYQNISGGTPIAGVAITISVLTTQSSIDLGSDVTSDPSISSAVSNPLGGRVGDSTTVLTDANGYYTFGVILGGYYQVTGHHPSFITYPDQVITIYITEDTNIDFIFSILWGNTFIDFTSGDTFL